MYTFLSILYFSVIVFFFFFKQKTAYEMRISDWSSDVCSSDLPLFRAGTRRCRGARRPAQLHPAGAAAPAVRTGSDRGAARTASEIGRASCRERVCQYV